MVGEAAAGPAAPDHAQADRQHQKSAASASPDPAPALRPRPRRSVVICASTRGQPDWWPVNGFFPRARFSCSSEAQGRAWASAQPAPVAAVRRHPHARGAGRCRAGGGIQDIPTLSPRPRYRTAAPWASAARLSLGHHRRTARFQFAGDLAGKAAEHLQQQRRSRYFGVELLHGGAIASSPICSGVSALAVVQLQLADVGRVELLARSYRQRVLATQDGDQPGLAAAVSRRVSSERQARRKVSWARSCASASSPHSQ